MSLNRTRLLAIALAGLVGLTACGSEYSVPPSTPKLSPGPALERPPSLRGAAAAARLPRGAPCPLDPAKVMFADLDFGKAKVWGKTGFSPTKSVASATGGIVCSYEEKDPVAQTLRVAVNYWTPAAVKALGSGLVAQQYLHDGSTSTLIDGTLVVESGPAACRAVWAGHRLLLSLSTTQGVPQGSTCKDLASSAFRITSAALARMGKSN